MSRKIAQRFCDNDMGKNKNLKRSKRILEIATRFKSCRSCSQTSQCLPSLSLRLSRGGSTLVPRNGS
ncbi:hypothetical protein E5S70_07935 [Ensifer adhaerens]|nr:hypothetical protein [Ensifer canadensis]